MPVLASRLHEIGRTPPAVVSGDARSLLPAHKQSGIIAIRRVAVLGAVAGYVVVFGAANLDGLYPAPMTGNTTQFAMSLAHLSWSHALLIGALLGSFFCGGLVSSTIRRCGVAPPGELLIMAALLVTAQAAASLLSHPLAIELPVLAFAMAMQGETASRFGGRAIQTIVVTNTILKCADGVVAMLRGSRSTDRANPQSRGEAWADVAVPACAWAGYFLGAVAAAVAIALLSLPLVVPVTMLLLMAWDLWITTEP